MVVVVVVKFVNVLRFSCSCSWPFVVVVVVASPISAQTEDAATARYYCCVISVPITPTLPPSLLHFKVFGIKKLPDLRFVRRGMWSTYEGGQSIEVGGRVGDQNRLAE